MTAVTIEILMGTKLKNEIYPFSNVHANIDARSFRIVALSYYTTSGNILADKIFISIMLNSKFSKNLSFVIQHNLNSHRHRFKRILDRQYSNSEKRLSTSKRDLAIFKYDVNRIPSEIPQAPPSLASRTNID
jgi:hypothetical protein